MQRKVAPIDVASETRVEPAAEAVRAVVRPAVDVVGIALSLANQQPDQRAGHRKATTASSNATNFSNGRPIERSSGRG